MVNNQLLIRPADHLAPEMDKLTAEVKQLAKDKGISLSENEIDDVLIVALFPQVGLKFLKIATILLHLKRNQALKKPQKNLLHLVHQKTTNLQFILLN